jgi:nucleoside diphosphate-linked moiety X motif protein 19
VKVSELTNNNNMKITRVVYNWREAATVILFAKHGVSVNPRPRAQSPMPSKKSIVLSSERATRTDRDYTILTLERTGKSQFMPSAFVFPGGGISKIDYSDKWFSVYENCGVQDLNSTLPEPMQDPSLRAPMFTKRRDWAIDSNVAFRICSIRETFEEAGILICKHSDDVLNGNNTNKAWKTVDKKKLQEWRPAVREDDTKFLEMCRELSLVPDIWSLHEWSCWLTPTNMDKMHHGRRYDTAFYTCALPKHIDAVHDHQEIVRSKVFTYYHIVIVNVFVVV